MAIREDQVIRLASFDRLRTNGDGVKEKPGSVRALNLIPFVQAT